MQPRRSRLLEVQRWDPYAEIGPILDFRLCETGLWPTGSPGCVHAEYACRVCDAKAS